MSRMIIFKICFLVIIWSVIILVMIGVYILFNLINLEVLNSIPPDVELDPLGDPDVLSILCFVLPLCVALGLSMRLFEKELMKEGDEKEK